MTTTVESSKLKGTVTETVDAGRIYFQKNFTSSIKQSEIIIDFSGSYELNDAPVMVLFSDGTSDSLKKIPILTDRYKFIVYSYYTKEITAIRVYPSFSVVSGRTAYLNSITIKKQHDFVSTDLQWVIGPHFFANASPSPLEGFATKRLFTSEGKIYLYGKENQHEIHVYDEEAREFVLYHNGIHDEPSLPDSSFYCSKVYLDGTVRFCFVTPSQSEDKVRFTFILYQVASKTVLDINSILLDIPGNAADTLKFDSLSIKPLWVSHYFLTTITHSAGNDNFLIKIDLSTNIGASYNCGTTLNAKAALEWFYDRIIGIGGSRYDGGVITDTNYQLASFRFNETPQYTINKITLGVTSQTEKRSTFFSIKSAKKLSSLFMNSFAETGTQREALVHYDDTSIDIITASLALGAGNGETNGDKYIPYLEKFMPKKFSREIQVAAFEDESYLQDQRIKAYHIPFKDNKVLIGVYDKLNYPTHDSTLPNYDNTTKLRAASLSSDLIGIYYAYTFVVKIYSGVTSDTIIVTDKMTGKTVDTLSFERNYETTITGVEELEENKFILLYGGGPAIASLIIHEDGAVTVKRYDGTMFGKKIEAGNNSYTIQEVDLTFLFDVESSEYELRKERN